MSEPRSTTPHSAPPRSRLERALAGELSEQERAQLEQELGGSLATWQKAWSGLELAQPAVVDLMPSLRARLARRATFGELNLAKAPPLVRAVAAMATVAGLALGLFLGQVGQETQVATVDEVAIDWQEGEQGLAESFWQALEVTDPEAGDPS